MSLVTSYGRVNSQMIISKLKLEEVNLSEALEEIEKITEYDFVFSYDDVEGYKVSVDLESSTLEESLGEILRDLPFEYKTEGDLVIISYKKPASQQQQKVNYKIKGKVTDAKGVGLPGVTVKIEGTYIGTATDIDGNFLFSSPKNTGILIVSFVGKKMQKIQFEAGKPISVKLKDDQSKLDEVTITAYGKTTKREMTGSITSVKSKDLEDVPSPSIVSLLQGRVAGMEIQQVSGAPGSGGANTTIRGQNTLSAYSGSSSPLWVIDGVPLSTTESGVTGTSVLADIDPSMIESMEVLKDASAASMYGSRAANGVILVTTKKGKKGKMQIRAKASYSYSFVPEFPTVTAGKLTNAWRTEALRNDVGSIYDYSAQKTVTPKSYKEAYDLYKSGKWGGTYDYFFGNGNPNDVPGVQRVMQDTLNSFYDNQTNWFDEMFRTGKVVSGNIQASGGSDKFVYNASLGYYKEDGIVKSSSFDRTSFMLNTTLTASEKLSFDFRVFLSYSKRQRSGADGMNDELPKIPWGASPFYPGGESLYGQSVMNSISDLKQKNQDYRARATGGLKYSITKDLVFTSMNSVDYSISKRNIFTPSKYDIQYGSRSVGAVSDYTNTLSENLLTYKKSINDVHNIELLAGYIYQKDQISSVGGSARMSPSDYIHYADPFFPANHTSEYGQITPLRTFTSNFEESVLISYIGRVKYNFDKKIMFEASVRRDGSSKFGKNQPWGVFPSISGGYAFSEESYMQWLPQLDFGKVRASWGKSGNTFTENYIAYGALKPSQDIWNGRSPIDMNKNTGLLNSNLSWEETDQTNIGLDLDFFNYKLGVVFDYYYRYTKGLLYNPSIAGNFNYYTGRFENSGDISNEGIELSLKWDVMKTRDFSWKMNFNISRNWNMYRASYNGKDISNNYIIGRPVNGMYVYKTDGIIQDSKDLPFHYTTEGAKIYYTSGGPVNAYRPGDTKYLDQNGDAKIDISNDRVYVGSPQAIAFGGILNEIRYKNFDFRCMLSYSIGKTILNMGDAAQLAIKTNNLNSAVVTDLSKFKFWEKPGDTNVYPYNTIDRRNNYFLNDIFIEDDIHYVKLKNIVVGYRFSDQIIKKLKIQSARVFVSGENLLTLTNYTGLDPETVDNFGRDSGFNYPLIRKFSLGLDIKF